MRTTRSAVARAKMKEELVDGLCLTEKKASMHGRDSRQCSSLNGHDTTSKEVIESNGGQNADMSLKERRAARRKMKRKEKNAGGRIEVKVLRGVPVGDHKETFVQKFALLVKSGLDISVASARHCPKMQVEAIRVALKDSFDCDFSDRYFRAKLSKTVSCLRKRVMDIISRASEDGVQPQKPSWVKEDTWKTMLTRFDSPDYKKMQERNKYNRSKQKSVSHVGRRGYAGLREELHHVLGRDLSCKEVFLRARITKKKDLQGKLTSCATEGEDPASKSSEFESAFGKVSRGRVIGCGLGMPLERQTLLEEGLLQAKEKTRVLREEDMDWIVASIQQKLEKEFHKKLDEEVQKRVEIALSTLRNSSRQQTDAPQLEVNNADTQAASSNVTCAKRKRMFHMLDLPD